MKRVFISVDVSNLYYSAQAKFNGAKVDYCKLFKFAESFGSVDRAIAYGAAMGTEADSFKKALVRCGFQPKYKEPKTYTQPDGTEYRKADWDVGIAIDAVRLVDSYDVLILCSADGDMTPCVEFLQWRGKTVIVVGCGISYELRTKADDFLEIPDDFLNSTESSALRSNGSGHASRQDRQ